MTAAIVDQPAGAFLMFSRRHGNNRGLDERFHPIWFEDVDFCARINRRGFVLVRTSGRGQTYGAHSIRSLALENRERYWYGSLLDYAAKHFCSVSFRTVLRRGSGGCGLSHVRGIPRRGRQLLQFIAVLQVLPWADCSDHGR